MLSKKTGKTALIAFLAFIGSAAHAQHDEQTEQTEQPTNANPISIEIDVTANRLHHLFPDFPKHLKVLPAVEVKVECFEHIRNKAPRARCTLQEPIEDEATLWSYRLGYESRSRSFGRKHYVGPLRIEEFQVPQIDLEYGPLIPASELTWEYWPTDTMFFGVFPVQAWAEGVEASVDMECQVQLTLERICQLLDVRSPLDPALFANTARLFDNQLYGLSGNIRTTMRDGSPLAPGSRIQITLSLVHYGKECQEALSRSWREPTPVFVGTETPAPPQCHDPSKAGEFPAGLDTEPVMRITAIEP